MSLAAGCAAQPPPVVKTPGEAASARLAEVRIVAPEPSSEPPPADTAPEPGPEPPEEEVAAAAIPAEAPSAAAPPKVSMPRPKTIVRARPRVRSTQTTVCCRLPPEVITRVIRSSHRQLAKCTEGEGAAPTQLSFVIAKDGSVHSPTVSSGSDGFKACMRSALSALRFPAPEGGEVKVTYPLASDPAP